MNPTSQRMWDIMKPALKGKFTALNAYANRGFSSKFSNDGPHGFRNSI
jgi:hypothetical protein